VSTKQIRKRLDAYQAREWSKFHHGADPFDTTKGKWLFRVIALALLALLLCPLLLCAGEELPPGNDTEAPIAFVTFCIGLALGILISKVKGK